MQFLVTEQKLLIEYLKKCNCRDQMIKIYRLQTNRKSQLIDSLVIFKELMKDKLSQIHKRIRHQNIQNYFKQRRIQLTRYRNQHSLGSLSGTNQTATDRQSKKWRNIILNGVDPSHAQLYQHCKGVQMPEEDEFQINITSIETGEYYLNYIVEGSTYNYLQESVYLLGRLVNKLLGVKFELSLGQEQLQNKLVYKILKQINYYLKIGVQIVGDSGQPAFQNSRKTRYILSNLLEDDYRLLFKKQDSAIITELINLSYELSVNYLIYPNYQVIKNITTRVITKQNLVVQSMDVHSHGNNAQQLNQKIEQLLMKFIIFLKTEESINRKAKNIHHLQIIHEFYSYIQFNLINIFQFVRNNQHPFDYEHINNNLYFVLTLYTEIIKKFKDSFKMCNWETSSPLVLIKSEIMDLIYNLVFIHSRSFIAEREADEFILTIQQAVSTVFRFVVEYRGQGRRGGGSNSGGRQYNPWDQWEMGGNDRCILDMLMVIKKRMRELQQFNE